MGCGSRSSRSIYVAKAKRVLVIHQGSAHLPQLELTLHSCSLRIFTCNLQMANNTRTFIPFVARLLTAGSGGLHQQHVLQEHSWFWRFTLVTCTLGTYRTRELTYPTYYIHISITILVKYYEQHQQREKVSTYCVTIPLRNPLWLCIYGCTFNKK